MVMDPQHLMEPVPLMTHFGPREHSIATKCPTCQHPLTRTIVDSPMTDIWSCENGHRFAGAALVDLL